MSIGLQDFLHGRQSSVREVTVIDLTLINNNIREVSDRNPPFKDGFSFCLKIEFAQGFN